ncbi:hypothetical protein BpHYR1_027973 [Brachionus plicatilis]|uniref:Uncharacterized protein n=1 Tax=Brachionus plicatilis TaxID=10195 RepID=A0A3M7RKI7_BRAPC|nr:hypothetical protein BpHYR1_027973 [Brachionus plicatilis]
MFFFVFELRNLILQLNKINPNIVPLCVQILKYVVSEKEFDEIRKFGSNTTEILIHNSFKGIYMWVRQTLWLFAQRLQCGCGYSNSEERVYQYPFRFQTDLSLIDFNNNI